MHSPVKKIKLKENQKIQPIPLDLWRIDPTIDRGNSPYSCLQNLLKIACFGPDASWSLSWKGEYGPTHTSLVYLVMNVCHNFIIFPPKLQAMYS